MKNLKKTSVFLVDDDPIFLKVFETQFKEQTPFEIKTFSTGEECLKNLPQKPDIIFLDYFLNTANPKNNNGLQILDKIKSADSAIPVVILSSQEQIEVAVNCMKHNALDYIVKSEVSFIRAQKAITVLINQKQFEKEFVLYKTSSIILSSLIAVLILVFLIMLICYPGWMNK